MKVLHLLSSNKFSGAENVVCQIISMFKNEEYEMAYCSPDGDIRKSLEQRKVRFFPLEKLTAANVKKVAEEFKPDVIHAHDIKASVAASRLAGRYKIISHIHGNHDNMKTLTPKSLIYLLSAGRYAHTFWVSDSSYNGYYFKNMLNKEKNSVLYNIISIEDAEKKMKEDSADYDYDVVYLGRLSYPKNPQRLIGVMEKCVKKNPDITCAMIGKGALEEEVKGLISEKKLESNIKLLGFAENPLKILHDAKVMLMTSRYEGTPMCALEAMSMGTPMVSTKTDGMVDLIENGKNGFLSDNNDELAEKICRIAEDKNLHDEMSAYTRRLARERMDEGKYKESLKRAYKS